MFSIITRFLLCFVVVQGLFIAHTGVYSQSYQKRIEKASGIVISDRIDNRMSSKRLGNLSEDDFCNDVNSIIQRNNLAIYEMSIGSYGNAIVSLNGALKKELELKTHLDNSVLSYNMAIANLFPGKNFCYTKLDSAKQKLLSLPLKHEVYGLNYYIGIADFYKGNFESAAGYFHLDFTISGSGRAVFSEIYSLYLAGAYLKAYDIYSKNKFVVAKFTGNLYIYRYILANVCSRANHNKEALRLYNDLTYKDLSKEFFKYFVAKSDSTLEFFLTRQKLKKNQLCYGDYALVKTKQLKEISVLFETLKLGKIKKVKRLFENNEFKFTGNLKNTNHYLKAQIDYQFALYQFRREGKVKAFTTAKKSFLKLDNLKGVKLNVNVLLGIVMSAYYCGETKLSQEKLDMARRLYPNDLKLMEAAALINFSKRDDEAAILELESILNKSSDYYFSYDAVMSAAFYYLNRNDIASYSYWLDKLQRFYSERAGYFAVRAIEKQGQAISATSTDSAKVYAIQSEKFFKKAIQIEPRQSTFYANYANLLFDEEFGSLAYIFNKRSKNNRYNRTKDLYKNAINLDRDNAYAYNGMAMCYYYKWQRRAKNDKANENHSDMDSAIYYLDKSISITKKNSMDIHFYRQSLLSLYLNKQWMLVGKAQSLQGKAIADSIMNQAWISAELGMALDETQKFMFLINQGVGWSQIGNDSNMNRLFNVAVELFPNNTDIQSIVSNNKGVFYLLHPTGADATSGGSKGRPTEVAMDFFKKGLESATSHTLVYYINRNIQNAQSFKNLRYIYYYDPVKDYRPRNIELNIEFDRPYFNPQIGIEISQMETFPIEDISSEPCVEVKTAKTSSSVRKNFLKTNKREKIDEGVHCPSVK
jgi:hypothetical protein